MLQGCAVIPTKHLLISAKFIKVYPGYELPGLTGRAQEACPSAAEEPSSGIHYPGFYVLKRWKRVQWLYVEGKHCLTLYMGSEV